MRVVRVVRVVRAMRVAQWCFALDSCRPVLHSAVPFRSGGGSIYACARAPDKSLKQIRLPLHANDQYLARPGEAWRGVGWGATHSVTFGKVGVGTLIHDDACLSLPTFDLSLP